MVIHSAGLDGNAPAPVASPGDPYFERAGRQWWLVIVLMLLMTLGAVDRQIVSLLTNPIKADLGITDTQFSFVYGAAFAFAQIAFTLPAGVLADRLSRRAMIGAGAVVWSFMTMLCGAATGYWQLLGARAGVGFGEAVIGPCATSMLRTSLSPTRRGRGFAVFYMAGMAGSALALILGGMLIGAVTKSGLDTLPLFGAVRPWQVVLILVGVAGLPLSLLMLTVREPLRAVVEAGQGDTSFKDALRHMVAHRAAYLPLLVFQVSATMSTLSFGAWIAPMIGRSYGLSLPQIGMQLGVLMLFLPPIGMFASGCGIDRAMKQGGVAKVTGVAMCILLFYVVTGSGSPLMPVLPAFWLLLATHLLSGGAVSAAGATMLASITPAPIMGKVASIQFFLNGLMAAAVGPVVVALVSDNLFEGPKALAYSLSLVVAVYSGIAGFALLLARRGLLRETAGET